MSQLLRYVGEAPVGAGIAALSGNGGFGPGNTAVADGNNNVNIVGFGTINVARTGANTLTISSTGVPATYTTNLGLTTPDILGDLRIRGDLNITTDAITNPHEVTINLNDDLIITGGLTADGDITATDGYFESVIINPNGLDSTGPTILHSLNRGVVQVNAAHTLFSNEGLDGQILIGSTVGPARWANITAGSRIAIVDTPNGIQINAVPQLPSGFHTDVGNAVPAAGILNIYGGPNIHTSGAGNSVNVGLNPDLYVDRITTSTTFNPGPSIITAVGSSIQSGFDITAANSITAGHDLFVNDTSNTTHLYVDNTTTLDMQRDGVLQTDAVGLVTATNSNHVLPAPPINGQVLISGPVAPVWNALTSADGTVVINTAVANHIDLSAPGATQPLAFRAHLDFGVPYAGNAGTPPYLFGTVLPLHVIFDTAAAFYPGDGAAAPATFTAPYNGIYSFTITACLSFQFITGFDTRSVWLRFLDTTAPYIYESLQPMTSPTGGAPYVFQPWLSNIQYSQVVYMAAGSVMQFQLEPKLRLDTVPLNYIIGPDVHGDGQCNITGFLVRRI